MITAGNRESIGALELKIWKTLRKENFLQVLYCNTSLSIQISMKLKEEMYTHRDSNPKPPGP